jgi:ABC-type sugar transport system substrate-binding protein
MKKRIFSVLLVFLGLMGGSLFAQSNAIKVGFVAIDMSADSISTAYKAMKEFGDKNRWQINLADCQGSVSRMSSNIINMVSWRADAIVVCGGEASVIQEGVAAADRARIPVFLEDTNNIGSTVSNATSNGWAMGAYLASQAMDRLRINKPNKAVKNVLIMGNLDLFVHRQRIQMYRAVLESPEYRDIKVIAVEAINPTDWAGSSYDIARTYLTKFGRDLDAILTTWDGLSWGVSRAILDAGFNKDQCFTMGIDGSARSYDMIRRGEPLVGVVAQDFGGWSSITAAAIQRIVVNKVPASRVIPVSKTFFVPYKWVDETNVPASGQMVKFEPVGLD